MTITTRHMGDGVVLGLSGRLVLYDGDRDVKDTVQGHVAGGRRLVVLEMSGVTQVDSAGLGVLAGLALAARERASAVRLLTPTSRVRTLIAAAKLQGVLAVYDDETEALGGLSEVA